MQGQPAPTPTFNYLCLKCNKRFVIPKNTSILPPPCPYCQKQTE